MRFESRVLVPVLAKFVAVLLASVALVALFALVLNDSPTQAALRGDRAGLVVAYHPLYADRQDRNRMMKLAAATDARWLRIDVYWALLQPERDRFDWGPLDRTVRSARARGLRILGMIAYTPSWARPPGTTDHYPPRPSDYERFVRALVGRYAARGVHNWEIWNEPNLGSFWEPKPDAAAYTELLRTSARAIHDVDGNAWVVSGGLSSIGPTLDWTQDDGRAVSAWRFLVDMYAHGFEGSFDALGYHPYSNAPGYAGDDGPGNGFSETPALYDLMRKHGDGHRKIWATEVGIPTAGLRSVTEAQQVRAVAEYLTLWQRWSFGGPIFYYELEDNGADPNDREDHFGLVRSNGSKKPAYAEFDRLVG